MLSTRSRTSWLRKAICRRLLPAPPADPTTQSLLKLLGGGEVEGATPQDDKTRQDEGCPEAAEPSVGVEPSTLGPTCRCLTETKALLQGPRVHFRTGGMPAPHYCNVKFPGLSRCMQPEGGCPGQPLLFWLYKARLLEMRAMGLLPMRPAAEEKEAELPPPLGEKDEARAGGSVDSDRGGGRAEGERPGSGAPSASAAGEEEGNGKGAWEGRVASPLLGLYLAANVAPLRRVFSWAVPTTATLEAIERACQPHNRLLEVGAGTGYWAHLLRSRGRLDVTSLDRAPLDRAQGSGLTNGHHVIRQAGHDGTEHAVLPPPFTKVEGCTDISVRLKDKRQTLFMCWPPDEEELLEEYHGEEVPMMAHDTLKTFGGKDFVFVGELPAAVLRDATSDVSQVDAHGAPKSQTAGPRFFQLLIRDWRLVDLLELPTWPNAFDAMSVWVRKDGSHAAVELEDSGIKASHAQSESGSLEEVSCGLEAARLRGMVLAESRRVWENAVLFGKFSVGRNQSSKDLEENGDHLKDVVARFILRNFVLRTSFLTLMLVLPNLVRRP